jgi:hypothetical protein
LRSSDEALTRQADAVLARAAKEGWRAALAGELRGEELDRELNPERAAFHQLMRVPDGGTVLELDAEWGGVSTELAKRFKVVAVERVSSRARFIAERAKQEGASGSLEVTTGDFLSMNLPALGEQRFAAVICHAPALLLDEHLLLTLSGLLAPGGIVYVGAQNRLGWRGYLASGRSYRGYANAFAAAGFRVESSYVSPRGYRNPSELVPFQGPAIRHYARMRLEPPGSSLKIWLRNRLKMFLARVWFWKWFGSDFVFLLKGPHA